jgi:hypothetical protein
MLLRDSDTGELRAYNIGSNQITGSAAIGKVGVNWEFSGVGNFSSVPGESDLILRDSNAGALQIYDINNNRLTGSVSVGPGLDLNGITALRRRPEFAALCAPDNPHTAGMPPRLAPRDELFPPRP